MAETLDYGVDCAMGVDGVVGPGMDDFSYCVADYDFCDLACWIVEVATNKALVEYLMDLGEWSLGRNENSVK